MDIRNFLTKSPKGTDTKKPVEKANMGKKRQRKYVLSDSDEEEPNFKIPKKADSPKCSNKNIKKSPQKKSPKSPTKSPNKKKVELPKVSIAEMLGKLPVKRVLAPLQKPKEEEYINEFGNDKEFEEAILGMGANYDIVNKPTLSKLKQQIATDMENKNEKCRPSQTEVLSAVEPAVKKLKSVITKNDIDDIETNQNVSDVKTDNKKAATKNKSMSPIKHSKDKRISKEEIICLGKKDQSKEYASNDHKERKEGCRGKSEMFDVEKQQSVIDSKGQGTKTKVIKKSSSPVKAVKNEIAISKNSKGELFELWVDKYKPTTLKQIIGQQGEKCNVNKLVRWLKEWHKNQNSSKKLNKPSPWAKDDSGAYFKAALLSGPPGVGKTTTAHLVCKELGIDMVEFNASDTRSKKLLSAEVSELLSTKSLSPFMNGGAVSKQHVLVMDEVDGMAGNEDRGGVQELIQLIKTAKVPIICMCNDRNHPKIRSLANYCFDLRFYKPKINQIQGAMMSICFKENLKIKTETLVEIISSTNQDIRLILNHLSMLSANRNCNMASASKHIKLGPWDVLKKVFSEEDHKSMSIYDKSDLFFHDYSVAPLFVHENYLSVAPHSKAASTKRGKMELFAKAASSLCTGDLMESAIRSNNAWSLLPVQAVFSSLIPGDVLEGHLTSQINFPTWFGKNSRRGKLDRFTQELQTHTRLKISGSKSAVNLDYAKPLRDYILQPLVEEGSEGIESALSILRDYNLLREDIESLTELSNWPGTKDPMSSIDSKVKAAFTRAYNKAPVLTPFSMAPPVKKGKGGVGLDEWEEEELEEGDKEEDITTDGMIVVKKKTEKPKKEKPIGPSASKDKKQKRGKK